MALTATVEPRVALHSLANRDRIERINSGRDGVAQRNARAVGGVRSVRSRIAEYLAVAGHGRRGKALGARSFVASIVGLGVGQACFDRRDFVQRR